MSRYRYIYEFIVNVYLESDEQIAGEIAEYSKPLITDNYREFFDRIDKSKFREGVDIHLLFQSLQWCADGFMRDGISTNKDIDDIDLDFAKVLEMYKQNFYKEEFTCTMMNTEIKKITR